MVHLYLEKDDSDPSSGFNLKEFFTRDPSSAATLLEGNFLSPNGNNLETLGERKVVTFFFCKLYIKLQTFDREGVFFFFEFTVVASTHSPKEEGQQPSNPH